MYYRQNYDEKKNKSKKKKSKKKRKKNNMIVTVGCALDVHLERTAIVWPTGQQPMSENDNSVRACRIRLVLGVYIQSVILTVGKIYALSPCFFMNA